VTRQARRAQERRQAERRNSQTHRSYAGGAVARWQVTAGIAAVIVALAIFADAAAGGPPFGSSAGSTVAEAPGKNIAGIGCNTNEQVAYHVHQALRIYTHGTLINPSTDAGHNYNHDCLYWLHVHNTDDVIHLEAPSVIKPTLGTFYAVSRYTAPDWPGLKLNYTPRPAMKVWVNGKTYTGNPMNIVLKQHVDIQIDFGPPYPPYTKFDFGARGV